jgi:hypothetical protein
MSDARPGRGTPIDLKKLRTIRVGRIHRDRVTEGRSHPETGKAWKRVQNEAGAVTEHNTKDDRVDAIVTPTTVPLPEALAERIRAHDDA